MRIRLSRSVQTTVNTAPYPARRHRHLTEYCEKVPPRLEATYFVDIAIFYRRYGFRAELAVASPRNIASAFIDVRLRVVETRRLWTANATSPDPPNLRLNRRRQDNLRVAAQRSCGSCQVLDRRVDGYAVLDGYPATTRPRVVSRVRCSIMSKVCGNHRPPQKCWPATVCGPQAHSCTNCCDAAQRELEVSRSSKHGDTPTSTYRRSIGSEQKVTP
jgi:hypothetical protein